MPNPSHFYVFLLYLRWNSVVIVTVFNKFLRLVLVSELTVWTLLFVCLEHCEFDSVCVCVIVSVFNIFLRIVLVSE